MEWEPRCWPNSQAAAPIPITASSIAIINFLATVTSPSNDFHTKHNDGTGKMLLEGDVHDLLRVAPYREARGLRLR